MISNRTYEEKETYKLYVCSYDCPYARGKTDKHTCEGWYYVDDEDEKKS